MNNLKQFDQGSHGQVFVRGMVEDRASRSRGKHDGESSHALCDRLSRTRELSQRQLPTDHDYAVSTREYQTDQSSLKTAPTAARSVLEQRRKQQQKQTHRSHRLTRSLHIRANALIEEPLVRVPGGWSADGKLCPRRVTSV